MPPRVWMPNFPLRLRFQPSPYLKSRVAMPAEGSEGTFRTDVLTFDTVQNLTKIEIKNFLQSVYGFRIAEVRSLNRMGNRRNEKTRMPKHDKDFKRFYVRLTTHVDVPTVPKSGLSAALD